MFLDPGASPSPEHVVKNISTGNERDIMIKAVVGTNGSKVVTVRIPALRVPVIIAVRTFGTGRIQSFQPLVALGTDGTRSFQPLGTWGLDPLNCLALASH